MSVFKKAILCLFISLNLMPLKAQMVEIGLMGGMSNYIGDLSDESLVLGSSGASVGLFGRYNISNFVAVKGFAGYGQLSADDKNSSVAESKLRNLNFFSDVFEFSVHCEYNILENDLRNINTRPFVLYAFGGIGVFNYNPKTSLNDTVYELQPLATEGQGSTVYNDQKRYSLTELAFPFGVGIRQRIGNNFTLGAEIGIRYTSTNYLDDVGGMYALNSVVEGASGNVARRLADRSWETDPTIPQGYFQEGELRSRKTTFENDIYIMAGVTLSFIIRNKGQGCPIFY